MVLSTVIDKNKFSCSYDAGPIVPTDISVFTNASDTVSFPIWDRLSVDGPPSSVIYRQLVIDSINTDGVLTLHREVDGKKEVFVYEPK